MNVLCNLNNKENRSVLVTVSRDISTESLVWLKLYSINALNFEPFLVEGIHIKLINAVRYECQIKFNHVLYMAMSCGLLCQS